MATLQPIPTGPRFQDLTGKVFGRMTVIGYAGKNADGRTRWLCRCFCGREKVCLSYNLKNGTTRSCGCLVTENDGRPCTHGKSETPEFVAWTQMKNRCLNQRHRRYADWGGRGIIVCQRWLDSFENFLVDMGTKPTPKHSLDRRDNNLGYCPENCRWATSKEQGWNRRNNHFVDINGITRCLKEWAEISGVNYHTIFQRVARGMRGASLIEPVRQKVKENYRGR